MTGSEQFGVCRRLLPAVLLCAPIGAQTTPFTCSALAPPAVVRTEGVAELLPEVTITCAGGTANSPVPVTIDFVAPPAVLITSREIQGASEAVLILPDGSTVPGRRSTSGLTWSSPVNQPGIGRIVLRIANMRVFVRSSTPSAATLRLTAGNFNAISSFLIEPRPASRIESRQCDDSGNGEFTVPVSGVLNPQVALGRPGPAQLSYNMRFREGFSNAFRNRAGESGPRGTADNGTRFLVRIANIPDGVTVLATTAGVPGAPTSRTLQARLINSDANGDGGGTAVTSDFQGVCGTTAQIPMARLTVLNGTAAAVWEVTASNADAIEQFSAGIAFAFAAPIKGSPVALGTLAPISTARSTAVPRFTESPAPRSFPLQRGLTFVSSAGGVAPPQQVALSGQSPSVRIETGVFPLASGVTPRNFIGVRLLEPGIAEVTINTTGLAAGTYTGFVSFDGDPITVLLTVLAAGSDPGPVIQPEGFVITVPFGAQRTEQRAFTITNTGPAPLTFNVPDVQVTGTVPPGQSVTRTFSLAVVGTLPPGVYPFVFPVTFSNGVRRNLVVRVILLPRPPTSASSQVFAAVPGCDSNRLVAVLERVGAVAVLPTSYPANVEALVTDNCGQPVDNAAVQVTFSSESTVLALQSNGNGDGRYGASWIPLNPRTTATLQLSARLDGYADGQATTTRDIAAPVSAAAPILGALQNAASQKPGAAPGTAMSIYGLNFAAALSQAQEFPLPTRLGGAIALVDLVETPLLFAAPNQINLVLPQTLEPGRHTVIVRTPNSISASVPFEVDAVAPGVFTTNSQGTGQGAVVIAGTRTVVDGARPARNGDFLEIYLTGMGRTVPLANAALAAPTAEPLARIAGDPVTVTIGGVAASVVFAGLTPGLSGLYQINVQMPAGIPPGNNTPVIVTVGGVVAATTTIAVQ